MASFCISTIVHNAMHMDIFAVPSVEYSWRVALSMTFGFPVEAFRPTHNMNHHVHTNLEEDHLDTAQMQYQCHLVNLLLYFPTVYPKIRKLEQDFIVKEARKLSLVFFLFVLEAVAAHGTTLALLCLDWLKALFLWFLPNVMGVAMIIMVNMLQHDGCEHIVPSEHRGPKMNINPARNFVGPVINFLTCNNGYHTVHHMHSTAHWTQYPDMHRKLVAPYINPELLEPCMARYIWRTFFWPGELPPHRRMATDAARAREDLQKES